MLTFPDESGFEKSQDGTDVIRGGSVGFNRILGLFKSRAMVDKKPFTTMVLINLSTVFRNNYDKSLSDKELFDACVRDMDLFLVYFEAYLAWVTRGSPPPQVPAVVYIPDYHTIPKDLLREHPPSWDMQEQAYARFVKNFPRYPTLTSRTEYTARWAVPVGRSFYPHIELARWVQGITLEGNSGSYRWGDPVCLITRNVIDLHIFRRVSSVFLLESYTAAIKTPDLFGTKLIKSPLIPFNVATHRAFGDSIHIKPLVMRSEKKELIRLAEEHKWMQRSYETILSDVLKVANVPVSEIQRTKF